MLRVRGDDDRIINAGIKRDTSARMLARPDTAVPAGTGTVIPQTGTEDAGAAGHDDTIAEIVQRLQARSIRVVPFRTAVVRDLRAPHVLREGERFVLRQTIEAEHAGAPASILTGGEFAASLAVSEAFPEAFELFVRRARDARGDRRGPQRP